jgi:threonine synthase
VRTYIANLFGAGTANQTQTLETMAQVYTRSGYLADPHTSVAIRVAEQMDMGAVPMVTLATAHPAKFPDAVEKATGQLVEVPQWAVQRADNAEVLTVLDNDLSAVKKFIIKKSRIRSGRNDA